MSDPVNADNAPKSCCTPVRPDQPGPGVALSVVPEQSKNVVVNAVDIPGGNALIGTKTGLIPDDGEGPIKRKKLKPFRMGETPVTNQQFADFVEETGFVTEAERYGWSFVFWSDVVKSIPLTEGVVGVEWWRRVEGADWRDIHGPGSEVSAWMPDHPVVHVSWNDATAYAAWAGGRLPTEAEWEHAARGGLGDVRFPWGDAEPEETGFHPCNIWQGKFPERNTAADGWSSTSPAKSYAPNGFGLYNMAGNVWEWTAEPYRVKSLKKRVSQRLEGMRGYKLLKGGSFLCHRSYCYRYRIAARSGNSPDSTTTHQGFRVVWDRG